VIDPRHFRDVLGNFATGVTVITARDDDEIVGLAANSFISVSLDPPLVGFAAARTSATYPRIRSAGSFCVNVLAEGQDSVARVFGQRDIDRFEQVTWHDSPYARAPILDGVLAWVDCQLYAEHEAGDHLFVVGEVLDLSFDETVPSPLLFFRGRYGLVIPE
jgi:3-hydroxy-9,10-secoandrosta-1,3,5(10)-triene-9,17-dione monooxygenase reductase component